MEMMWGFEPASGGPPVAAAASATAMLAASMAVPTPTRAQLRCCPASGLSVPRGGRLRKIRAQFSCIQCGKCIITELRRRHQALVRVAAAGMEMLVAAPDAGPAGVGQRLAGAAATVGSRPSKTERTC